MVVGKVVVLSVLPAVVVRPPPALAPVTLWETAARFVAMVERGPLSLLRRETSRRCGGGGPSSIAPEARDIEPEAPSW